MGVKGYKMFNSDWTCRGYNYGGPGTTHRMDGDPQCCWRGFHFCIYLRDCFNYYGYDANNKVAEVLATGKIRQFNDKSCTNELTIVRELSWEEVFDRLNPQKTAYQKWNTGDSNFGFHNSGNNNVGDNNSGNHNVGDDNSGNSNRGNYNSGNHNAGSWNSGNFNTGCSNSGDFNNGDCCSGVFCDNENSHIWMFNKESCWTYEDWRKSQARAILITMPDDEYVTVNYAMMTKKERKKHPEVTKMGGTILRCVKANRQEWWLNLSRKERGIVMRLPNFDTDIFYRNTGIKVKKTDVLWKKKRGKK